MVALDMAKVNEYPPVKVQRHTIGVKRLIATNRTVLNHDGNRQLL